MASEGELKVLEANRRFYAALEALDLSKMTLVWLHDDWVKCVHPGWGVIIGWENVRRSWESIFQNTREIRIALSQVTVRVENDVAWVCCIENISNRFGGDFEAAQAFSTNIFILYDDQWLLAHHHGSLLPAVAPLPPAETIQ